MFAAQVSLGQQKLPQIVGRNRARLVADEHERHLAARRLEVADLAQVGDSGGTWCF